MTQASKVTGLAWDGEKLQIEITASDPMQALHLADAVRSLVDGAPEKTITVNNTVRVVKAPAPGPDNAGGAEPGDTHGGGGLLDPQPANDAPAAPDYRTVKEADEHEGVTITKITDVPAKGYRTLERLDGVKVKISLTDGAELGRKQPTERKQAPTNRPGRDPAQDAAKFDAQEKAKLDTPKPPMDAHVAASVVAKGPNVAIPDECLTTQDARACMAALMPVVGPEALPEWLAANKDKFPSVAAWEDDVLKKRCARYVASLQSVAG